MSKEIKSMLKETRVLLNNNQYLDASKKCQKILKLDENNYMAMVMLAAATKEIEEHMAHTPNILKKAITLQPDNPLAWHGLVSFYEKQPATEANMNELIAAYCKVLQVDTASPRFTYHLDQLLKLMNGCTNLAILQSTIEPLTQLRQEITSSDATKIDETIIKCFIKLPKLQKSREKLFDSLLESVIRQQCADPQFYISCYQIHLKNLFNRDQLVALLAAAAEMHQKFPKELCPLEWICRVYWQEKLTSDTDFSAQLEIEYFYQALLDLEATSVSGLLAKAMHFWDSKNLIEARDFLNQVVVLSPTSMVAHFALAELNAKLHCWAEVESATVNAMKYTTRKTQNLYKRAEILLVEALANADSENKWEMGATKCAESLSTESSTRVKLALARIRVQQQHPDTEELLSELESDASTRTEATVLRALGLMRRECLEEAMDVLGSALETSEAWQLLGEINCKLSNHSHSLMAFLKAVHADPFNWHCFVHLGLYYRERGNDLEKSRKCYQKALRINPNSDEAGAGLSTTYRMMKNCEANMQMLQRVTTEEGGGPKWAWLQLGLQQLDQGDIAQAIKSLRYVIRADPNDNHCWESLADAYWARGAHTSALKSYARALELSPGSLYPMIQLANIQLVLGRHEEARDAFLEVLKTEQQYIPALKGLAETCLGLMRDHAAQQLLGRARRNAQQALDCLTDAIMINSNLSCLWKLLGETCYGVATLPDKYAFLEVVPGLVKSRRTEEKIEVSKNDLMSLAARSYCRALSLFKDSALLWHDLACCYLSQLDLDAVVTRRVTMEKCFEAAKQAVRLSPASWVHWNLLGVVCMKKEIKNYALAQHCWVMAIDREPNNAMAWTNLGTLYLHLGDPYKANEAFSRAQRADPDYQNSWIGQALIAESIQDTDAMDLFRHATQLGYHPQAALGYAHWVLTTLLDPKAKENPLYDYVINNMHAITVAGDAMTWFCERETKSVDGHNDLGLILERQKLLRPAANEFRAALAVVGSDEDREAHVRTNLARVLVQMGEFNEAIEVCRAINKTSFTSHCQLALALFKAAKYEESYAAYEAALNERVDASADKAHVLCAMASMAYMFQDVDDAKTLLFQCIQIQPPIVAGLLAAAALGLLHNDANLTSLVLRELEPFKDNPKYRHHVGILTAYLCLMQQDITGAVRVISKTIFRRPDDVGSWVGLIRILLETNSSSFGSCAQKALYLGRKSGAAAVVQVASIASLGQMLDGGAQSGAKGLRTAQKTIHAFPGNVESWVNLAVAQSLRTENDFPLTARWMSELINSLRVNLEVPKALDEWLVQYQKQIAVG